MKSTLRILLLISSILFLSACGSEDEELEILGNWEIKARESEGYQSFSETEAIAYTKHLTTDCFNIEKTNLLTLTPSTFSITSTQDQVLNFKWSITSDSLTITNSSIQTDFLYTRTQKNLDNLQICSESNEEEPVEEEPVEEEPVEEEPVEEEPVEEEPLPILGNWEVTNDDITSYYTFSNQQILIRTYIDDFECHSSIHIPLGNISSTSLENNDGDISTYTITGDILTIEEDFTLTRPDSTPDFVSCADPDSTGTLEVSIEFENLPSSFLIPEGTDEEIKAFYLNVSFDLSVDDSEDTREFGIYADYYFEGPQSSNTVLMTDLASSAYYYAGGDRDFRLTEAPYTINGNTITFSFNRNEHKIFKEITNTSDIKVDVSFQDLNSDSQYDYYPASGYTDGIELTEATDETGDVSGSFSTDTIVDIKSVTVTVTP